MLFDPWSVGVSVVVLAVSATILVSTATRVVRYLDVLADRTGMGEALVGGVVLGATTSLPGLITTVVVAADGDASLAVSNAVGGVAVQTTFLVVADAYYRRVNLEHAAASLANTLQAVILIVLLGFVVMAVAGPELTVVGIHPISAVLVLTYVYGLRLSHRVGKDPMWRPEQTPETRLDEPEPDNEQAELGPLVLRVVLSASVLAVLGFAIAQAGSSIAVQTGLSGSVVGATITGVVTSLPEAVTLLAAVRRGALALAVGDIIGGNTFDVLFLTGADVAYREGSVFHAIDDATLVALGMTLAMTSLLVGGLLVREKRGIGFEGLTIPIVYAAGVAMMIALQ